MFIKLCILSLLIKFGYSSSSSLSSSPIIKGTEPTIVCAAKGGECDETKSRPVCGTDNETYPTRCHLIRAQCSGHQVSLEHRGACKDTCLAAKSYAETHSTFSQSKFIPNCRADGTFAPVQCLEGTGCWCVNSQGKLIPNTTIRSGQGKPSCLKIRKSNPRRSPTRNNMNANNNNKICSRQVDRILFNTNLIKMFHSEYLRYLTTQASAQSVTDKIVLDWKFSLLDTNTNHMLDKNEFRELKRIIKKAVKPKRCARAFGKFCDKDQDERLSRQEWSMCLSKEGLAPDPDRNHGDHTATVDLEEDYDTDYNEHPDTENSLGVRPASSSVSSFKPVFLLRGKTTLELSGETSDPIRGETDLESGCLADRLAALDEQKSGAVAFYIPECTPDGRYQRIQCYRSTGYCWCVHEDTGKNIPGTSAKDQRPQCDAIIPPLRPMKGCPENKKNEFLRELKSFLKSQIASNTNTGADSTKWRSEDEKIATLSFVLLDKNKNKVWERKEWKTFRDSITTMKQLRKCGKKMPRYCDVNSDRKITLSEWLNCLQTQRIDHRAQNESRPTTQSKLKGKNPLESYLKSDR